ncbi:MAG: XRE family transcriptional regulator [Sphingomonas sp.]
MDSLTRALADRVKTERKARAWSLGQLADQSGVSPAMISKIERAEVNATAVVLGKLSGAFGIPLSDLLSDAGQDTSRLTSLSNQPLWTDPESGYSRRALSPRSSAVLRLTEVEMPAGARVAYPAAAYAFQQQQLWMLSGILRLHEGDLVHDLAVGDCLAFGAPADCVFENISRQPCRYLIAIAQLQPSSGR